MKGFRKNSHFGDWNRRDEVMPITASEAVTLNTRRVTHTRKPGRITELVQMGIALHASL